VLHCLHLLYIASPALPIGGFAWSHGLAQAIEAKWVRDEATLRDWLATVLQYGLGRADLPLLLRAYQAASERNAEDFSRWNSLIFAGRESAELWLEEREIGQAIKRLLLAQRLMPAWLDAKEEWGHVAAFALLAAQLEGADAAGNGGMAASVAAAYAWSWLENQIAAATKCMPLGQNAAQAIALRLLEDIPPLVATAGVLPDDEIGASLHGLAIASSRHEELHSRMFRS
jgi:urease accessory protein